jgi:homoserine dehydrogenase
VTDAPGVLATIAGVFAEHNVSLALVEQSTNVLSLDGTSLAAGHAGNPGTLGHEPPPSTATLVIGTHEATEAELAATVQALAANSVVITVASVIRVEGA